jgi:hypothetical protein
VTLAQGEEALLELAARTGQVRLVDGHGAPQVGAARMAAAERLADVARSEQPPVVGFGERPAHPTLGRRGGEIEQRLRDGRDREISVPGDVEPARMMDPEGPS